MITNRIERRADERMAAFQGRLDVESARLPRSNEFIRSCAVNVVDIEVYGSRKDAKVRKGR